MVGLRMPRFGLGERNERLRGSCRRKRRPVRTDNGVDKVLFDGWYIGSELCRTLSNETKVAVGACVSDSGVAVVFTILSATADVGQAARDGLETALSALGQESVSIVRVLEIRLLPGGLDERDWSVPSPAGRSG